MFVTWGKKPELNWALRLCSSCLIAVTAEIWLPKYDCRNMTAEIWPARYDWRDVTGEIWPARYDCRDDCRDMTTELWWPMLLFTTLGVLTAKLTSRSSQDSSLGLMNTGQMLWATGAPTLEQRMDLKKQFNFSLVPRPPNLSVLVACSANMGGFTRPSTAVVGFSIVGKKRRSDESRKKFHLKTLL